MISSIQTWGTKCRHENQSDMVSGLEILANLVNNRDLLSRLRQQGMSYARESLTWDAKARSTTRVLTWAVGRGLKPDLIPPKMLQVEYPR